MTENNEAMTTRQCNVDHVRHGDLVYTRWANAWLVVQIDDSIVG